MQDNGRPLLWLGLIAVILLCGGGAIGFPYFLGPEAESRAVMMLRTPMATSLPTPNPTVVHERDVATANTYKVGGQATVVLIVVGALGVCVWVISWAARAGAAAGARVKAAKALPPHALLPDGANLVALPGGYEVFDPRFGSVRELGVGDAAPDLEVGQLMVGQQHPIVDIITALLQVPVASRGPAWRRAAQYHSLLEDGDEA